jgi:hypothetical protein
MTLLTPPDTNTILMALITSIGWVISWFHGQRNGMKKAILIGWQHRAMWEEYAKKKGLPLNGG